VTVAIRQRSQDSVNQVGQQWTRKNLNVQPTLMVRPGFPLRIIEYAQAEAPETAS
jgi:type IV secretory pathway VirB10-like protein